MPEIPAVEVVPLAKEAPVEADSLFGTTQRTTVWCVFGRALRRA